MIRPDFAKWGQPPEEIYQLSLKAAHVRSRERFQALYMIGTQQINATVTIAERACIVANTLRASVDLRITRLEHVP